MYLTYEQLAGKCFLFANSNTILCQKFYLAPNGFIAGYNKDNECKWDVRDGILSLLHRDGHQTCQMKFVAQDINHRLLLWGPYENRGNHGHYLVENEIDNNNSISFNAIAGRSFTFSNCRTILSTTMVLAPNGEIEGYSHDNEFRWGVNKGVMEFYHRDGHVTTQFFLGGIDRTGKYKFCGPFNRNGSFHSFLLENTEQSPTGYSLHPELIGDHHYFFANPSSILCFNMFLRSDGWILKYIAENETGWRVQNGQLQLLHRDFHPTSTFHFAFKNIDDTWSFWGSFESRGDWQVFLMQSRDH
jgi:hypothetical protein